MTFARLYDLIVENPSIDYWFDTPKERKVSNFIHNKEDFVFVSMFHNYKLFEHKQPTKHEYYICDEQEQLVLFVALHLFSDVPISDSIWKSKVYDKDLMLHFFIEFLLSKYDFIQSTQRQSTYGMTFWIKLINYGILHDFKCSMVDLNDKEEYTFTSITAFSERIDNIWGDSAIVLRIYAK